MKSIIIALSKIGQFILKKLGRGSSFPGVFALKLDKNILGKFKLPRITICITGTTGKTSITTTLASIYEQAGYKVGTNNKASNLIFGVTSLFIEHSDLRGNIKSDVLIVEVDERYVKKVFKYFKPNYFIVNNLSRDQMARNGHYDIVWKEINNSITDDIHLILNADDPLIYKLSLKHKGKVTYYGLKQNEYSSLENIGTLDLSYCPICHKKLEFDYFNYGNLGKYHCSNNDFNRPKIEDESELIDDNTFKIDDQEIHLSNNALYNIYNLSACYVAAKETGIKREDISKYLNNLSVKIKRLEEFKIGEKEVVLTLSKNDTPSSYNSSIDYVIKQPEKKTVILGFNTISIMYNIKDISWMYDVNFELLRESNIEKIICTGKFATNIATRLKYADIDMGKIEIIPDSTKIIEIIKEKTIGKIYLVFPFDMEEYFRELIKRGV